MAFGDNYNDLEMLAEVKNGVAMENSPEAVKKLCPYHTALVEDTLQEILEENMIKLVASDIDGTLVPEGTTSINRFYEIIRKLKEKGILFVGASGRQYSSMRALLDPVLMTLFLSPETARTICERAKSSIPWE